jgi:hypothetical protein
MELKNIGFYDVTLTLSLCDCQTLARATRHASQFGDSTGLYERGAAWNTQEEADHLVDHLEAMSVSFQLAAKYA